MDLAAELARFNPDPALANWITGAVQNHINHAQQQAAHASAELRTAQTKIRFVSKKSSLQKPHNADCVMVCG